MAQYCRYCNNLVTGNGIYCTAKKREIAESTAKSTNKCKLFELNYLDAFCENMDGYKPRKPLTSTGKKCDGQMKIDLNYTETTQIPT